MNYYIQDLIEEITYVAEEKFKCDTEEGSYDGITVSIFYDGERFQIWLQMPTYTQLLIGEDSNNRSNKAYEVETHFLTKASSIEEGLETILIDLKNAEFVHNRWAPIYK